VPKAGLNDVMPLLEQRRICLPAFDIAGGQPDFLFGVLQACEAARCPALLLVYAPAANYLGLEACADLVGSLAKRATVPVILHLDHGQSEELAQKAIDLGFNSIMFDGSALPLEENIRRAREVARLGHARGVLVEAELGRLGEEQSEGEGSAGLTHPEDAARFVRETGVDLLAPAVGNAHGFYTKPPKLRFDLIEEIAAKTRVPLSLHGGTGLPAEDIRKAASLGVRKLNIATQLHKTFGDALKAVAEPSEKRFSWWKALAAGRTAIKDLVAGYICDLGAEGLV
jgi:fructose-bisphosphate aldolase class II